ncbi:hypothetical protein D7B24_004228 [Verticillium nonalfalfae]|uniref:Uncharacterized protein n=1 Tax=Verticillium nonalfalfae TaxID=1051616 RepID=A0A3M9XV59_9PEZI|nr:uncharacterized protein D7B24_004228 [Verticillium nonalfalfae]RNJ52159.1 hypothetical protein D7B24_004228 [Verticillium nonalfalfae]
MTLLRLSAFRVTPNGIYRTSIPLRSSVLRPLLHKTLLHKTLLHKTLLHKTLLHKTLLHKTLLHKTLLHKTLHQARSNSSTAASKPTPSSRIPSSSSINKPGTPPIPEHLLIYHAGTSRITFLALWKITSLFLFAFFTLIAAPSYARRASQTPEEAADATTDPQAAQKTYLQAAGLALCGVIPLVYVAYTTAPFVTFIYLRLPPAARASRQALERFVRAGPPPTTQLELLTMGLATRPRSALTTLAGLRPVTRRLGLVNYERDVAALEARRAWHQYRPVAQFGVRVANCKGVRDAWVWDAVRPLLGKTARERRA